MDAQRPQPDEATSGICAIIYKITYSRSGMNTASRPRWPAFLCASLLFLCVLATHPVAETGMVDDWSYVQSVRVLAQTGHIVYNGWAAPILGWQLFLGALFARLFGPSFTAIRASTFLIALITAFLTQRTFVRVGINSRNATVGTLDFVLSPLFLPFAFSLMTEVDSVFCVILCLYACLRALQAQTNRAVLAWLGFAALSNAVGGTVRQIAWLGVLVIFPCTVWLLRRRPHVLVASALLYVASVSFVFASLHWFAQQPYSVPEHLFQGFPTLHQLQNLSLQLASLFLSGVLLLLPVLIAFVLEIPIRDRRVAVPLACGLLLWFVACALLGQYHSYSLTFFVVPRGGNYVSEFGLANIFPLQGHDPIVLSLVARGFITFAVILTVFCFFAFLNTHRYRLGQTPAPVSCPISWNRLLILSVPFTLAYLSLLLPRGLRGSLFDRYLLPLLPIALMLLLRLYQDRVQPLLPLSSCSLVLLFALYAVAGTHDAFAMYRAKQAAVDELLAAGIPSNAIDAGFDHNAMTQVRQFGFMNDMRIHMPATAHLVQAPVFPADCKPDHQWLIPAIVPGYSLSYDSTACGGPSHFAPVFYNEWLVFRSVPIYIVNTVSAHQ